MLNAANTHSLLGHSNFAICLVRPDGDILYRNPRAHTLFGSDKLTIKSLPDQFVVADTWRELVTRSRNDETVADEPVIMHTAGSEHELCFLTLFPQRNLAGELDALLCVWTARRNALADRPDTPDSVGLDEYTRDLEAILEHRTYRQMILADMLEHARHALDALSVGILIADATGTIRYHNHAVSDTFGFRRAELAEPHLKYLLSRDQLQLFERVQRTGFRDSLETLDSTGAPATIEFLPLVENDTVASVVLQFSRALPATLAV